MRSTASPGSDGWVAIGLGGTTSGRSTVATVRWRCSFRIAERPRTSMTAVAVIMDLRFFILALRCRLGRPFTLAFLLLGLLRLRVLIGVTSFRTLLRLCAFLRVLFLCTLLRLRAFLRVLCLRTLLRARMFLRLSCLCTLLLLCALQRS